MSSVFFFSLALWNTRRYQWIKRWWWYKLIYVFILQSCHSKNGHYGYFMVLSVYGEQRNSQGMYCIIVWRKKKELHFILWDILKLDVGIYTQYICLPIWDPIPKLSSIRKKRIDQSGGRGIYSLDILGYWSNIRNMATIANRIKKFRDY